MSESDQSQDPKQYRLAIRRPVTTIMFFLTLIVFGWRSYQQLPINLMPDISYPTLTVRTEYEGAAPEDVEKLVTVPLEEMLSIVSGMVEISSVSSPGLSEIILEFSWDTDMNRAQQDVRDRLDLFDPPREVTEKPVILRYDPTLDPVMRVAITAPGDVLVTRADTSRWSQEQDALTAIRETAERHLKSDLEQETGIAQAAVKGGTEQEIQVLVDSLQLKGKGLSLQHVEQSLAQQNINLSGGQLKEGKTEYLVRTLNEFTSVEEVAESILVGPNGEQHRLADLARVFMGTKERETIVRINGKEAVALDLFKEGDANTVTVCNRIKDLLGFERELGPIERIQRNVLQQVQNARSGFRRGGLGRTPADAAAAPVGRTLRNRMDENVEWTIITDQSRFIIGSIQEVQSATVLGGLLALCILFLFLRELKATLIIGIAIPISVIATFLPMFTQHISLNIMSLGGLALGVGMLVDNAIVVLESIFRCREEGDGVLDAAERGTKEVGAAVTASTLTTISVFLPIAFVEGIAGQLFGDLALTVTFSLLASLLTALYLIPLIASRKSMALRTDRQVVWLLRAYKEGREVHEHSRMAALALAIPRGVKYAGQYIVEAAKDTLGPSLQSLAALKTSLRPANLMAAVAAVILLPFLVPLYGCQLALRLAATIGVTMLFGLSLAVVGLWLVLRTVLRAVLWLPLYLFDKVFTVIRNGYAVVLEHSLRFNAILLLMVTGVALHAGFVAVDLGRELIPPMKQGEFGIRMEARAGTRLEQTEALATRIEAVVRRAPEVASVTVEIGQERASSEADRGENVAEFTVLLADPDKNALIQDQIIERLRGEIAAVSSEDITFTLPSLFSFKTAVELQVFGDDLKELKRIGEQALAQVAQVRGVKDADLSVKAGYPEIIIELDRELLASKGISPVTVAQRLRREVQGEVATRFSQAGEKIDIRVRTDKTLLNSIDDLKQLSITEGAAPIPLSMVARIRQEEGPSEIRRIDQRQVVLITANVENRDLGAVSDDIMAAVEDVETTEDYFFLLGGQNRELKTSYKSLQFALLLAIFLVYVVMACQFESVLHPALVMFAVPLAFIGVIYMLAATDTDLSIMVFLGGIILAGIVVNDAIVLVDYINQLRARGYPKRKAIVEAGKVRLRPIIMTTVTTVLGLLPMLWSSGEGAEMRRPMALTVMAGLSSATVLTLLVIPMAYDLFGGRDKS